MKAGGDEHVRRSNLGNQAMLKSCIPQLLPSIVLAIVAAAWPTLGHAQATRTWSSTTTNGTWSVAGNWTSGTAPVANDSLAFNATTGTTTLNNNIAAATQFNGITFNVGASAYTLTGNQVTLGGSVINNSSNLQTIALPLAVFGLRTFAANSGAITVTGSITGNGGLTLSGRDTLTLAATNTFSGATAVNAGTLLLDYSAAGNTADPLGTSAITLDMGTLVLRGKTSGATTETISALNMGNNFGIANTLRLDANGGSGIAVTVTTFGLAATAGSSQNFNLVDLSSSSGNSLVASGLSASGTVMNGVLMQTPSASNGRANLVVRDSAGYGFATLSGATSGTLGRLTAGTVLTASNSSNTANYFLTTAGTLTRTASLDYSTITLDSSAGDVTLALGSNQLAPSGSGRGILVTGPNNVSITGSAWASGVSTWFHNYSSGTFTLGQSTGSSGAFSIMFGGTGLTVWTGTFGPAQARFYAEGITFRPTTSQAWAASGLAAGGSIVVSSGAVLEVGADLNGETVGDLSNQVRAWNDAAGGIQFYGDSGVSAFGGDRVVGFRTSGTGALQSLTWGASSFLTQANGTTDGNFIFKLSSDRSDSLVTVQNAIALGSLMRTVEVANGSAPVDADLSGVLSGAGGLTKTGAGTLRLSGANTFTGPARIASGTLVLGNSAALSGAAYSTDGQGGTLSFGSLSAASLGSLSGSTGLALQNDSSAPLALTVGGNGASTTFSGVMSGSGSLVKSGAGTFTLSANNTYAGTTTVNAGTLVVGTGTNAGSIGTGNVVLGGGALQFSRSDTVTPSQAISGSGTLRMLAPGDSNFGNGVLVLSGSNSFAGTTSIERGTIRVSNSDALGTSAVVGSDSLNNKSMELVGGFTLTNAVTLGGGGQANTGVLVSVSGSNTLTNFNFGSSGGTRLRVDAGSTLRITNNISDPSNIGERMLGGGTLVLDGNNSNAFTLDPTHRFSVGLSGTGNGTIAVGNDLALGTAAVLFDASSTLRSASAAARSLANPFIFGSNAAQLTLGSADTGTLALSGTFTLQRSGTLAVANSLTTISGPVVGAGFGLTKTGAGTLGLTGVSSFSGATSVAAGRLVVDGSILASSGVSVSSGAELAGSGAVAAITGGGLVAPGNSPGILSAPSANLSGGLDFAFEFTQAGAPIWGTAANSGNDILRLTNLSAPLVGTATAGNVFDIYFAATGETYLGGLFTDQAASFESLISGATFNYFVRDASGPVSYQGFSYSALSFGDVTRSTVQVASAAFAGGTVTNGYAMQFVVVPEPGALALAGLGITAAAWAYRRRRS
jgi:autotransporter-associated beta strand protein